MAGDTSIEIAPTGFQSLKDLKSKKTQREIAKVIDSLAKNPEGQGKAVIEPLEGIRSVRSGRNQYRILYRVDSEEKVVSILLIGKRKPGKEEDVYALARKLLKTFMGRGSE